MFAQAGTTTDDHGDKLSSATIGVIGNTVAIKLDSATDIDIVRYYLQSDVTYCFTVTGDAANVAPSLRFGNLYQYVSGYSHRLPDGSLAYYVIPHATGWHSVSMTDQSPELVGKTFQLKSSSTLISDNYQADTSTPGQLLNAYSPSYSTVYKLTGTLDTKSDWFAVDLSKDNSYQFSLQGEASANGLTLGAGAAQPVLALMSADGKVLQSATSGGNGGDPLLTVEPSTSGRYYLAVSESSGTGGGTYRVQAKYKSISSIAPWGEKLNFITTYLPNTLKVGGTVTGTTTQSGNMELPIYLTAGATYEIAWLTGGKQTSFSIAAPSGGRNDGTSWDGINAWSTDAKLEFTAAHSGYYTISASLGKNASYQVSAKTVQSTDDFADEASGAAALPLNSSTSGTLTVGDQDWFMLNLEAGTAYKFILSAQSIGNNNAFVIGGGTAQGSIKGTLDSTHGDPGTILVPYSTLFPGEQTYTPEVSGQYWLHVESNTYSTATYTLQVQGTDIQAPITPTVKVDVQANGVADSTNVLLYGTSDSGTSVLITDNSKVLATVKAGLDGTWAYRAPSNYAQGAHSVTVKAADAAGNYSATSDVLAFSAGAPHVAELTFALQTDSTGYVAGSHPVLSGKAEAGATVQLLQAGVVLASTPVDSHGNWTLTTRPLANGSYDMQLQTVLASGTIIPADSHAQFQVSDKLAVSGTGKDDRFTVQHESLYYNGADGIDSTRFPGKRSDYQLGFENTLVTVKDTTNKFGTSTLENIERIFFDDSAIALDVTDRGNGGVLYRLYRAAFDAAGVGYWLSRLDADTSLRDVAQSFLQSDEMKALLGTNSSNGAFVNKLYTNVLHRAPDQAGLDYWIKVADDGASRADILVSFSESPENQAVVAKVIAQGFAYTPYG
jgi:hypothetical protein